jgi:hypothetical protein
MASPRYPRSDEPLPPPLPPGERTVGQLVAETIRLYGRRFWPSLALGLPLALKDQLVTHDVELRMLLWVAFAPAFAVVWTAAVRIETGVPLDRSRWLRAVALGTAVLLPAALLLPWFGLLAFAWLALVGLAVPVVVVEGLGARPAVRRAVDLARADYVHALGSIATLVILFVLTRLMLALLLQNQGEATDRIGIFLADLVLSPMLFLGSALLYYDQAARLIDSASRKRTRRRRRRDADLHPADDPHGTGRPDAEVEPGSAARGQR